MTGENRICIIALALVVGLSSVSAAENDKPTSNEIAKELANPNTVLTSLKLQNQYFSFDGDLPLANEQDMFMFYLQPVLPFPLKNGKTLWVRPGVPFVIDQPIYDTDSRRLGSQSGLGDITLDVQYGKTLESGFLWSIGFSSIFPTAFKEGLGSEVFALGPGFQLGRIREKSIFGVFANHVWDIAGESKSSPDLPYLRRNGWLASAWPPWSRTSSPSSPRKANWCNEDDIERRTDGA